MHLVSLPELSPPTLEQSGSYQQYLVDFQACLDFLAKNPSIKVSGKRRFADIKKIQEAGDDSSSDDGKVAPKPVSSPPGKAAVGNVIADKGSEWQWLNMSADTKAAAIEIGKERAAIIKEARDKAREELSEIGIAKDTEAYRLVGKKQAKILLKQAVSDSLADRLILRDNISRVPETLDALVKHLLAKSKARGRKLTAEDVKITKHDSIDTIPKRPGMADPVDWMAMWDSTGDTTE